MAPAPAWAVECETARQPGNGPARVNALDLSPQTHQPHPLHGACATWAEKNCYGDMWVSLLHALGLQPLAILPFTLAVDFEGDQWTFFKPPHGELWDLYGIDVQELSVWRPLLDHAIEHLASGKLVSTEADAFWLPDTAATDYRRRHRKTTVTLAQVDTQAQRLCYFHNAGYFELEGDDFRGLFRLDAPDDPSWMPLFAELFRIDRLRRRPQAQLAAQSWALVRRHHERRPRTNPFERFAVRLAVDLPQLQAAGLELYHEWAFANVRQAGSAFELAAANLDWLGATLGRDLQEPARCFAAIAQECKTLILKGARAVNARKPLDAGASLAGMAAAWERGMSLLARELAQ